MRKSFEAAGNSSEQGEHRRRIVLTKLGGDALDAAAPAAETEEAPAVEAEAVVPETSTEPEQEQEPKPGSLESLYALFGEKPPTPISEAERRVQADRSSLDSALRMFGNAANEDLSPEDRYEVELSLDVLDDVSEQFDDEENDQSAYDILNKMVQRYDRLARKAPTEERRQKYFAMAQIADKQKDQFGDWKGIDAEKNRQKTRAELAFDDPFDTSGIV